MIIECTSECGVRLAEPFDFRRFKLVLTGDAVAESRSWRGIIFIDDHNALVPIDLVPNCRAVPPTAPGSQPILRWWRRLAGAAGLTSRQTQSARMSSGSSKEPQPVARDRGVSHSCCDIPISLYVRSRRIRDDSGSGTIPAPSSCEIAMAASTVRLLISSF